MKVRDEINKYASEEERPILIWLFDRFHMESEWRFVAYCTWDRYGVESYAVNRVWHPTPAGRSLHVASKMREALLECEPLVGEYPVVKHMVKEALALSEAVVPKRVLITSVLI